MTALERLLYSILAAGILLLASTLGVRWYGETQYKAGYGAREAEVQQASLTATVTRVQENSVLASTQQSINLKITEVKNEETAPVAARIAADRVRVGAASCGPGAGPANPESSSSSDGANPPGRLVRDDVERDTRALALAVELDLATGRACQAFIRENGMAPP